MLKRITEVEKTDHQDFSENVTKKLNNHQLKAGGFDLRAESTDTGRKTRCITLQPLCFHQDSVQNDAQDNSLSSHPLFAPMLHKNILAPKNGAPNIAS